MEDNEIINTALAYRYNDIKSDAEKIKILSKAYKIIFAADLCLTCPGDVLNGYYRIHSHFKNPLVMKKVEITSNFKLKEGVVLTDHSTGLLYSNANLTDEAAKSILTTSPGSQKWFEVIPGDFQPEKVAPSGAGTDDENKHKNEALEFIKDDSVSLGELKAIAQENGFPSEEWSKIKSKGQLREYLREKING